MRISSCTWLLGVSFLLAGAALAAEGPGTPIECAADGGVVIDGECDLVSRDFGARDVLFRQGAKPRAAPGSTVELAARKFDFEKPVTLDARGASGEHCAPGAHVAFRANEIVGRENVVFVADGGTCTPGQLAFNPPVPPVALSVTVSGGISLGSWEAGYNWALVREIKKDKANVPAPGSNEAPPLDLAAVTGASAGSINTFLSAITWCQTEAQDRQEYATRNVFHDTWVRIGLPKLIPADGVYTSAPGPDGRDIDIDAYLSTAAFKDASDMLEKYTTQADFRAGCFLPIGMTVTRSKPVVMRDNELEAPVDRFSIALEARVAGGRLQFYDTKPEDESAYVRPYLHFTDSTATNGNQGDAPLPWNNVFLSLKTSSAFPVAFGQQHLTYFEAADKDPAAMKRFEEWFWDGGLYDNIPVGLALSLVEKPPFHRPSPTGYYQMFSIDPERRRMTEPLTPGPLLAAEAEARPPKGLSNLGTIAGDFFSVSRKYEMQNFIRFAAPVLHENDNVGDPMVSSRFMSIFGERLGAFGAFVLEAFREFDFAAGIYDALHALATYHCDWRRTHGAQPTDQYFMDQCLIREIQAGYQDLNLDKQPSPGEGRNSTPAGFIVKQLLADELAQRGITKDKFTDPTWKSAWDWMSSSPPGTPAYAQPLLAESRRVFKQGHQDNLETELGNIEKIALELSDDYKDSLPAADQTMLDDSDWFNSNMMRLLRRAETVERQDQYPAGKTVTAGALFFARTSQSLWRTGIQLDPSTVPDDPGEELWHLLPYHLSFAFDFAQAGWLPTFGLTKWLAVGVPLSVDGRWGPYTPYHLGAHGGLSLIVRPPTIWIPAIEVTPLRVTLHALDDEKRYPYFAQPFYGFEVALYVAGGKIRLAFASDQYRDPHGWVPYQTMRVTAGVADLNGLLYHFGR